MALVLLAGCEAPISKAIRRGDSAAVAARLDQGEDVNEQLGSSGRTPLQIAAAEGRLDVAKLLLDRGADVNLRRRGTSALSQAVIAGNLEMTKLLLAHGAEAGRREILWARGPRKDELVALLQDAAARQAAAAAAEREAAARASGAAPPAGPASSVDAPAYRVGEHADDVALVVAISKTMDGVESRFAAEDAAAIRAHLIALGWPSRNVVLLSDQAAGRAGLTRYLERWLPNNVVGNSRVVFYFAGAGTTDRQGRACLLPWDGDAGQPETTGYPLARVYEMLNALQVRTTLAVIDAGFSGAGPRTAAGPGGAPAKKVDLGAGEIGSAVALIAAGDGEPAGLEESERHGRLTYLLLKGLNGGAVDEHGAVTLKGLYRYARAQAVKTQTPQALTGGLGEGDLRLR